MAHEDGDGDDRKRPEGPRWIRDQGFVDRLKELLNSKRKTPREVAAEVSLLMGYRVKANSITKLKTASLEEMPSSAYIGHICELYKWPVPPLAEVKARWGTSSSHLHELRFRNPQIADEYEKKLEDVLVALRKISEPDRGTPGRDGT
jgi:hypothetical protein